MAAPEAALQAALYSKLTGDSGLMAAITGVYDMPLQQEDGGSASAYPFLRFGAILVGERDTDDTDGTSVLVRLHTWSAKHGFTEAKTIQALIYGLLHRKALTVTGQNVILMYREQSDCNFEPDTRLIHGVCEYRILLEAT